MLRTLQRPIALILLPHSLFFSTGCTSVRTVPAVEAEPPTEDNIAGVTTLAGIGFEFDSAGGQIQTLAGAEGSRNPLE